MKTPDEVMAYFKSMPSKRKENPFWKFIEDGCDNMVHIHSVRKITEEMQLPNPKTLIPETRQTSFTVDEPIDLSESVGTLRMVREFFRRYHESFHSESQVLCVTPADGDKLIGIGIPKLGEGCIGPFEVYVMVLPQDNSGGNSVISEVFWQDNIVAKNIVPVARIHSHHILEPYQSVTDYSTLNSGTLEMVIGKIRNEELNVCYWLDVPGTDTKAETFLAKEKEDGTFTVVHHIFNGPRANRDSVRMILNSGAGADVSTMKSVLNSVKRGEHTSKVVEPKMRLLDEYANI